MDTPSSMILQMGSWCRSTSRLKLLAVSLQMILIWRYAPLNCNDKASHIFLAFRVNYDKANHSVALSFTKGWLPCRWVLPGWTIFEGSCTTLPRSTNEKLGYDGWATSRSLWNPQLFRGGAFVLWFDQKGTKVKI